MESRAAIEGVAAISGIFRIRYTTSHPRDMDDDLIAAHGEIEKLMPFLHLPVQSGSDTVLAAMNRQHTSARLSPTDRTPARRAPRHCFFFRLYCRLSRRKRRRFRSHHGAVRRIGFSPAFSFKYTARPGTPAASLPDQVPDKVGGERLHALQCLIDAEAEAFDQATVGRRVKVLFERTGRKPGQMGGRSPYLQAVHGAGPAALIGQIVEVDIVSAGPESLTGFIKSDGPP